MPALPLDEAGKYVAGAYIVFLVLLLVYVSIMAARLARVDRELGELADLAERQRTKDVLRNEPEAAGTGREAEDSGEVGDTGREAEDVAGGVSV